MGWPKGEKRVREERRAREWQGAYCFLLPRE
jgi:hypothetical protein